MDFIKSDGEENPFDPKQQMVLAHQTISFALGHYFKCPPHMWDGQTHERVMLDFLFMRATQEMTKEEMDKMQKNISRYNVNGGHHKGGRPLRTTSDEDYFDRVNQQMRD
tara:strand:+ start:45 stop:371 length:327 start_codon:yes stop_codon:yes gene_type:complete